VADPWRRYACSERRLEAYYLQRTRFETITERKLRLRQLTDDGIIEITGRDFDSKQPLPTFARPTIRAQGAYQSVRTRTGKIGEALNKKGPYRAINAGSF
jgi:hypothetical protein